jgi:ankyrin repeat protein
MFYRNALAPRYRKLAFYWATLTRNRELMALLMEKSKNFAVRRSSSGPIIFRPPVNPAYTAALIETLLELDARKIIVQDAFDLCTPLHEAARQGHHRHLGMILESSTELDVKDIRGWTALFHAIWEGRVDVITRLIDQGCKINTQDNAGMGVLHLAAVQRDPNIVRVLLDSGADCNVADSRGWTPIEMREFTRGDSDPISMMILKRLKQDYRSSLSQTALHMAVLFQDLEMATHFLDQGSRINDADILGCTALHDAAVVGYKEMVDLLLSRGAAVDVMNSTGKTPLHCLLIQWPRDTPRIAWALLDSGADVRIRDNDGNTVFDNIINFEVFQSVREKLLLQRLLEGMDIDFISTYGGSSLLNIAVEFGNEDCIRVVLDNGAGINDFNQEGVTVLHQAVSLEKPGSLIQFLLDRGADPNSTTPRGYTFMDVAFIFGYFPTPLLHIALGNPHFRSRYKNQTYLHLAVRTLDIRKLKIFITLGVDINAQDIWGITALHLAVKEFRLDMISLLINSGADTNIRDVDGLTPLADLLKILNPVHPPAPVPLDLIMILAEGVDLDMKDSEGNTVLDIAMKYKHYAAAKLLISLNIEGCVFIGTDYCNTFRKRKRVSV